MREAGLFHLFKLLPLELHESEIGRTFGFMPKTEIVNTRKKISEQFGFENKIP